MVVVIKMLNIQSSSALLKESGGIKSAGKWRREDLKVDLLFHMKSCEILPVAMFYCKLMVHVVWSAGSKLRVFFICAKLWNPFYETLRWKLFFSRHRLLAIRLPPLNENCSAQLEGKQKDLCCTYGSRKQCGFYFSSPLNKSWELASFL